MSGGEGRGRGGGQDTDRATARAKSRSRGLADIDPKFISQVSSCPQSLGRLGLIIDINTFGLVTQV